MIAQVSFSLTHMRKDCSGFFLEARDFPFCSQYLLYHQINNNAASCLQPLLPPHFHYAFPLESELQTFTILTLFILSRVKVRSHGAAASTAFLLQSGESVYTVRQQLHYFYRMSLPLPHRIGSESIYLRHCCRSRNSVNTH